jgi:hypothetical protein
LIARVGVVVGGLLMVQEERMQKGILF